MKATCTPPASWAGPKRPHMLPVAPWPSDDDLTHSIRENDSALYNASWTHREVFTTETPAQTPMAAGTKLLSSHHSLASMLRSHTHSSQASASGPAGLVWRRSQPTLPSVTPSELAW